MELCEPTHSNRPAGIPLRLHFADDSAKQEQAERFFLNFVSDLAALMRGEVRAHSVAVRELRNSAIRNAHDALGPNYQPVCVAVSVLCDLASHGWKIERRNDEVEITRPEPLSNRDAERGRVREALLIAREEQLCEPAVRAFIKSLETRRYGSRGWHSIHSLMRDGAQLAASLREAHIAETDADRQHLLAHAIQPYLQFVNENARCEWTGIRLLDIWRYFRYTWLTAARSTPGRTMMVLVRDAAVEPHPVIGIAALSSSIVQQSKRDSWIGWDRETLLKTIQGEPSDALAGWLLRSLSELIEGIFVDDLLQQSVIADADLQHPSDEALSRLRRLGADEREKHKIKARQLEYKRLQSREDWPSLVLTHLYKSKRALTLAHLLGIRRTFAETGFTEGTAALLRKAATSSKFKDAVGRLVRFAKGARVGINMMDISVAGAIAPYNAVLGGKLVSLLLASPEVGRAYAQRYGSMPSKIASSMKGEAVLRVPNLVLLCTTGLFSGGSSQYNRVRMPAVAVDGVDGEIEYLLLDEVTSYGTFHFSQATMREMRIYSEQWHDGSEVHGIFGEGVNPKMRKIRESLDCLGFPADELLRPGSSRALYVVPLARNFREILLGQSDHPDYILPDSQPQKTTARMVAFWRSRWLSKRIGRPEVLQSVAQHRLTYPVTHGAAVELPTIPGVNEPDQSLGQLDLEDFLSGDEASPCRDDGF